MSSLRPGPSLTWTISKFHEKNTQKIAILICYMLHCSAHRPTKTLLSAGGQTDRQTDAWNDDNTRRCRWRIPVKNGPNAWYHKEAQKVCARLGDIMLLPSGGDNGDELRCHMGAKTTANGHLPPFYWWQVALFGDAWERHARRWNDVTVTP